MIFHGIGNLVKPTERPHVEVRAGLPSHGRRDAARMARADGKGNRNQAGPGASSGRFCRCCHIHRRRPVWNTLADEDRYNQAS
jgi:hypothetical protein